MSVARRRTVRALVVLVAPLAIYLLLVWWLRGRDAATLMLGAASGASYATLAAMALALLLRVYTVVVLPGVAVYALVSYALGRALQRRG